MQMAKKIRNVLLKCFFMSILMLVVMNLVYLFKQDWLMSMFLDVYQVPIEQAQIAMMYFYGSIKSVAVFIFLIPAIAIHCEFIAKCCCNKKSCEIENKEEN